MTKDDLISVLEIFIGALKAPVGATNEEPTPSEPVKEQPQPIVEQIIPQPPPQPVIEQQPIQQLPATGWDILRHNQQKITELEAELNRMKVANSAGIPISQYPTNYMTPITPVQHLPINTQTIGGAL
jgi:hypothetical protein